MDNNEQPSHPSQLLVTPLMISLIGILSTAVAILLYNFIVTRYCATRQDFGFQQSENSTGVEEKTLSSIPVIPYTVEEGWLFSVDQTECSVCLCEFDKGEVLRLLPTCRHAFHIGCIDQWLFSHTNCPLCRSSIVVSSELALSLLVEAETEQSTATNTQGGNQEAEREGNRLLSHSSSGVLLREGKLKSLQGEDEKSLSLDNTYIAIKIQRDTETDSSQPSSSSSTLLRTVSSRHGSSKPLELVSTMVMNSYSRLRLSQGNTRCIIPR
ncbi:hypothetical protein ACHQM5_020365 [Ranunculus cassubicifolius]